MTAAAIISAVLLLASAFAALVAVTLLAEAMQLRRAGDLTGYRVGLVAGLLLIILTAGTLTGRHTPAPDACAQAVPAP